MMLPRFPCFTYHSTYIPLYGTLFPLKLSLHTFDERIDF